MGRILLILGLAVLLWTVWLVVLPPHDHGDHSRREDMNNVRLLVGILATSAAGVPVASDGRIDVYRCVREITDERQTWVWLCSSERSGVGPTLDEILVGDYTHFPYERRMGAIPNKSVPLVWDREPDADGRRLLGFSDRKAIFMTAAEWSAVRPLPLD